MHETARMITITVREGSAGLFYATSIEEPSFFLCVATREQLLEAVPLALEDFFRSKNQNVAAIPANPADRQALPWAIVPRDLLKKAAERSDMHVAR